MLFSKAVSVLGAGPRTVHALSTVRSDSANGTSSNRERSTCAVGSVRLAMLVVSVATAPPVFAVPALVVEYYPLCRWRQHQRLSTVHFACPWRQLQP